MNMATSTYYYKPKKKASDRLIIEKIQEILSELPETGYIAMTKILKRTTKINKKKVYRIMSENGLLCNKKARFKTRTTDSGHNLQKFPNLIKDESLEYLNVIFGDVTAFDIQGKDAFLACLMRHQNREVLGYAVSFRNDTDLVLSALISAEKKSGSFSGYIHHTDTDVRYCSSRYINKATSMGFKISMCKGNAYENAFAESLNKTIKYKEININEYENIEEAYNCLDQYFHRYNNVKPHSSLKWLTPVEYMARSFFKDSRKK